MLNIAAMASLVNVEDRTEALKSLSPKNESLPRATVRIVEEWLVGCDAERLEEVSDGHAGDGRQKAKA
jgi:hypothetical protein